MIKVHPAVKDKAKFIKKNAKKVGLDKIDFSKTYRLVKLGAKNQSELGYPDKMVAHRGGAIALIGTKDYVWLYIESPAEWFKTSPIQAVTEEDDGYRIETENSFYKLLK